MVVVYGGGVWWWCMVVVVYGGGVWWWCMVVVLVVNRLLVMMVVPGVLYLFQFLIDLDQIKSVICTIQYVRIYHTKALVQKTHQQEI